MTSINHFKINEIIHNALKKRLASRWIPHESTDQNRMDRVEACKENLKGTNSETAHGGYVILLLGMSRGFICDKLDTSRLTLVGLVKVKVQES